RTQSSLASQRLRSTTGATLPGSPLHASVIAHSPSYALLPRAPAGEPLVGGIALLLRRLSSELLCEPLEPLRPGRLTLFKTNRLHPSGELPPHDHCKPPGQLANHGEGGHLPIHEKGDRLIGRGDHDGGPFVFRPSRPQFLRRHVVG